jgi:hypothetical protein
MRDDRRKWTLIPDHYTPLSSATVTVAPCPLARQTLISGATVLQDAGTVIGWPDIAGAGPYTLCLTRDQVLEVEGEARASGWDAARGRAISDMTDGYLVFDISGAGGPNLLSTGGEISVQDSSRSVVRRLWGMDVLLYRYMDPQRFRLHVTRSLAPALYHRLGTLVVVQTA